MMLTANAADRSSVATKMTRIGRALGSTIVKRKAKAHAWNSRGVPAPVSSRMINPKLYPATWIK